jgi:enoyl-CoA hydratase
MTLHSHRDGLVFTLTLNRPARSHAYNAEMLEELELQFDQLSKDPPAVLVLQSQGARSFCAGADLKEMQKASPLSALQLRSQLLFTRLARLPLVSIAAIHGPAVAGGMEMALACDLRVAGPDARFWLPETSLGILPSAGGTTRLARLVGVSRAKEVILGGRQVDAETALSWGLVHRLAADPQAEAQRWATEVASRNLLAQQLAKQLLDADERASGLAGERVAEAILYSRRLTPPDAGSTAEPEESSRDPERR